MLKLFWSRLSGLLPFLAANCWLQNAITPSQIVSSWLYFLACQQWHCYLHEVLSMGSLHGPLALGPLVHLAVTQPPVDTLAREFGRVLARTSSISRVQPMKWWTVNHIFQPWRICM